MASFFTPFIPFLFCAWYSAVRYETQISIKSIGLSDAHPYVHESLRTWKNEKFVDQNMATNEVNSYRILIKLVSLKSWGCQLSNGANFVKIRYELTSFVAMFWYTINLIFFIFFVHVGFHARNFGFLKNAQIRYVGESSGGRATYSKMLWLMVIIVKITLHWL